MEKVFVYGTLKRGYSNNYLLQSSEYLGYATTKNRYAMYSSGIPYVTEQLQLTNIVGEVYNVSRRVLKNLDMLEGHPQWYVRKQVTVLQLDGEIDGVWIYFNEQIPDSAKIIESGIYSYSNTHWRNLL